jgi:hypothetical protein
MPSIASPQAGRRFVWTTFWNSGASWTRAKWSGKERGMCKDNIAAYVSVYLPQLRRAAVDVLFADGGYRSINGNIDAYVRQLAHSAVLWF